MHIILQTNLNERSIVLRADVVTQFRAMTSPRDDVTTPLGNFQQQTDIPLATFSEKELATLVVTVVTVVFGLLLSSALVCLKAFFQPADVSSVEQKQVYIGFGV